MRHGLGRQNILLFYVCDRTEQIVGKNIINIIIKVAIYCLKTTTSRTKL